MTLEKENFFQRKFIENIEQLEDFDGGSVLIVSEFKGNEDISLFFREKGFEVTNLSNEEFASVENGKYKIMVVENYFNKIKPDLLEETVSKTASMLEESGLLITFFFSEKDSEKEGVSFVNNRDLEALFNSKFSIQHIRTMMDGTRKVTALKK